MVDEWKNWVYAPAAARASGLDVNVVRRLARGGLVSVMHGPGGKPKVNLPEVLAVARASIRPAKAAPRAGEGS